MPDITLCTNDDCPKKWNCYRYLCVSESPRQSYALFEPDKNGNCDFYREIKKVEENRKDVG